MWYYAKNGQQLGPVALEDLRARLARGEVQPTDLIWTEGMANWEVAHQRPEFAGIAGGGAVAPAVVAPPLNYSGYGSQLGYGGPAYVQYAGFWLRFVAALIDGIILAIPNFALQAFAEAATGMNTSAGMRNTAIGLSLGVGLLQLCIGWLYAALMESSEKQATLGKMALGIIVVDESGQRLTFARASGRHFAKLLSMLTLYIGFMMAGWTERKQALHDMLAGALVIRK